MKLKTSPIQKIKMKRINARCNRGRVLLLNDYCGNGESEYAHSRRLKKIMQSLGRLEVKIAKMGPPQMVQQHHPVYSPTIGADSTSNITRQEDYTHFNQGRARPVVYEVICNDNIR